MKIGMRRGMASAPHGVKRPADDDLKNEQRLAKRFDLLNLEQNGKLYVPVEAPLPTPPVAAYSPSNPMLVDDSRDRVYVHNLDEEIKEIEQEEERAIFLPDIEKKLAKLPQIVLSDVHPSAQGKQIVLYSVPESISVPKEQDSVRKAIAEARERARKEQVKKAASSLTDGQDPQTKDRGAVDTIPKVIEPDADSDLMDIG